MSRKVKANLDDIAAEELRGMAYDLQIPEGEVLRRGLAIMRYTTPKLSKKIQQQV